MELTVARIPLLESGLSLISIRIEVYQPLFSSELLVHALLLGPCLRDWDSSVARSSGGTELRTSLLFEVNLCK